ncbi:MAG: hypothetical protein QOJ00_2838 [Actinomycetota bacterium]
MATVLHVIERYLDLSSGFVHGQISRSRHRGVVISRLATENLDAFPLPGVLRVPAAVDWLPASTRDRAARATVLRQARRVGADIGHAHFGYALPYARILNRRAGLPVVVSLHGHDATAWAGAHPWAYAPDPGLVATVIVPSRWLASRAATLGFAPDRVRVIPSGVDTAFFAATPVPNEPVVAFVGRLVEKKGIDTLMQAWPRVRATVPDARLRVLGAGPLAPLVHGEGVEAIAPCATRRAQQVRDVIRSAAVVATPSHTGEDGDAETLLLVNLEAQASGRPVVTTDHGGITEFVEADASALVVPEADAAALAAALVRVLTDTGLRQRLAARGPSVAARFEVRAMAARVDDLYDEVLDRPGAK